MTLMRRDPFYRPAEMRGADVQPDLPAFVRPFSSYELAVDMYETGDAYVVTMAVPGIKPDDLQVTMTGNSLTIRGELPAPKSTQAQDYVFRERRFGSFTRTLSLPKAQLDLDAVKAEFHNGLLMLTLPKAEEVKAKVVQVKVK